jgi:hypothetical protein
MLKKKWPNKVISEDGFSIQIEGRGSIVYQEGDRKITLNSEYLIGWKEILVYQNSITSWDNDNALSLIESKMKEKILTNVKNALSFLGISMQVI